MTADAIVRTAILSTIVTILLTTAILSVGATGTVAATNHTISNPTDTLDDDQLFEGTEDGKIVVWERTFLPLRTNDTGASTQVPLPGHLQLQELGPNESFTSGDDGLGGSRSLLTDFNGYTNPAGVHDPGEITLSYNAERVDTSVIDNETNVDFIAARLTGNGDDFPADYSDAVDLFGNIESANANATFEVISENETISGTTELTHNFDTSGEYIVYATANNGTQDGYEISNGQIDSINGSVAVVGLDLVSVHEGQADVTSPTDANPGDDLSFEIDTTSTYSDSQDGDMTHVVALYDKDTFENSRFELVVDRNELGPKFDLDEDSQIEHSIRNAEGVADVQDGITVNGADLSDGRVTRSVGLGGIVDRLSEDLGTTSPVTDPIGSTTINASVVGVTDQNRQANLTVETDNGFKTGSYQYIVVSKPAGDASSISTRTGTVNLRSQADQETPAITDVSINDPEIATGETVSLTATVANPTDSAISETLSLSTSEGADVDTQDVTIPAGESDIAVFETSFDTTGDRTLNISGEQVASVTADPITVVPPVEKTFSISDKTVEVDDTVTVETVITNNRRTTQTIPVEVTGAPEGSNNKANVTVGSESSKTYTFTFSYQTSGSNEVSISGVSRSETVEVAKQTVSLVASATPSETAPGENVSISVTRADTGNSVTDVSLEIEKPNGGSTELSGQSLPYTTSFDEPGQYQVTITKSTDRTNFLSDSTTFTVLEPANLSVTGASTPFSQVIASRNISAETIIENTGGVQGTETIRLVANDTDEVIASRNVTVSGDGARSIVLDGSIQPTGDALPENRPLEIQRRSDGTTRNTISLGTVSVISALRVTTLSPQSSTVNINETVDINVTVANQGTDSLPGTLNLQTVNLTLDGVTESNEFSPDADSSSTKTYTFGGSFNSTGSKDLTVTQDFVEKSVSEPAIINVTKRDIYDVELAANTTTPEAGETVGLNVTSPSNPLNVDSPSSDLEATVEVVRVSDDTTVDSVRTSDGEASVSIPEAGTYLLRTTDHEQSGSGDDYIADSGRAELDVLEPGDVEVVDASVITSDVARTEPASVSVTVANPGETTATETISLTDRSNAGANQSVTLSGQRDVITLTTSYKNTGSNSVTVGTNDSSEEPVSAGTIQVNPILSVSDIRVEESRYPTVGESVSIAVDITNEGTITVNESDLTREITLDIGALSSDVPTEQNTTSVFNGNPTYNAGETYTITFSPDSLNPTAKPGTRTVAVDSEDGGRISVSRESVGLSLSVSGTQTTGEPITFRVNRTDTDTGVDANIRLPDRTLSTGDDGVVTETFANPVSNTVTATKASNTTEYYRDDSQFLSVTRPANLSVVSATTNTTQAFAGQSVAVDVVVSNLGGTSGSRTINLTRNGATLDSQGVTLSAGEQRTIELVTELDETGNAPLTVEGESVGTVTVADAVAVTQSTVPSAVTPGGFSVNVTVTDRVSDSEQGSRNVTISVGNSTVGSTETKNITPPDGSSTTPSFNFNITQNGTYPATIATDQTDSSASIGEVTVSQNTVALGLTVSESEVKNGDQLTFDVTKGGTPATDASVEVAGKTLATDDNGSIQTTIATAGNYTAVANKPANETTGFQSDSVQVNVTDSIDVTLSSEFGDVNATPTQGSARSSSAIETRTVRINNTGGRSIALSGFGFTGVDADQYTITSTTPSSVSANDVETVTVRFAPTVRSNTDARLRFKTDTPNTPVRTLTLNGTGVGPDVELNTTALEFGAALTDSDLPVNRTINVTNDGNEALTVTPDSGSVVDAFTVLPSATTIPAHESKELTVKFKPEVLGRFGDVLSLSTNDTFDSTIGVSLIGTVSQTELSVSSTSVDVGEVPVDGTASTDIVVTNTGTESISEINTTNTTESNGLVVTSPSDEGPVIENLAPGAQALLTIDLKQTADAAQSKANLTLIPSGEADNKSVIINAAPTAPSLSVTPSVDEDPGTPELDFEDLSTGSTTASQFVVDNTGDAPLRLTGIQINSSSSSSPFRLAGGTQEVTVPAGEQRSITVEFAPQTTGVKNNADLEFAWNNASADGTTTVSADLRGKGTETALTGDSSTVSFGTTGVGSTVEKQLKVTNDGTEQLNISGVTLSGLNRQFNIDRSTVPDELAAGANTSITIEYAPTRAETHTTGVTISASSSNGFSSFTATLQGEAAPPDGQLTDPALSFGFVNTVGSDTAHATTQIKNTGRPTTTLNITNASIRGNDAFSIIESPEGTELEGTQSTVANISFDPSSGDSGTLEGTLTIETNDPDESSFTVSLSGVATAPVGSVNRSAVSFGEVSTDTGSPSAGIEIRNDGGAPLEVTDTSLNSTTHFTLDSGFNGTVVPGDTATVAVSASPTAIGQQSTNLTITTANDGTRTIELTTTGITPAATVSSDISGDFDEVGTGSSAVQTLIIQNDGAATLDLENISASGNAYTVLGSQQSVRLAEGETTEISVAFSPTAQDTNFTGVLSVDTNDDKTQTITRSLTGDGGEAVAAVSESAVEFGQVGIDTTSETELTLSNDGNSPLTVTSATIAGSDESAFEFSGLGTPTLDPGEAQSFDVSVSPTTAQSLSGRLEISTQSGSSDVTVSLGAVGTQPELEVSSGSITFDRTRIGATSSKSIEIQNPGNSPLNVRDVLLATQTDQFSVGTESTVVPPKDSRTVTVRFTPNDNVTAAKAGTQQTATITLRSNDTDTPTRSIDVTARSKTPDLQVDDTLRYGTLTVGQENTKTLEVSNEPTATANIDLDTVSVIGPDAGEFDASLSGDSTLEPGDTKQIDVSVAPDSPGIKTGSLLLTTNDPRQSLDSVSLSNSRTIVIVRYGSVTFDYRGVTTTDPKFKSSSDPSTGVIGLDPSLNVVTDFNMTFSTLSAGAAQNSGIANDRPVEAVRYLDISTDGLDPAQHNQSTVEFRVDKSTLNSLSVPQDGISLYQYNATAGEYTALSTTRERGSDTATEYAYSATFDTLNDLAIGAGQPSLSVTNASASNVPNRLGSSDSANITITTTVDNAGSVAGSDTFSVVNSEGTTLNSTTINVGANSNTQEELTVTVTGPGDRTLTVTGAGTSQDVSFSINSPSRNNNPRSSPGPVSDDTEDEQTAPTAEQVRQDLEQTEPTAQTSTEIVDDDPDTPGVSISPEGTRSVRRISFEEEGVTGSVDITEYDEPPTSVSESITAALTGTTGSEESADDGSDDTTESTPGYSVATVADISPTSQAARDSAATVTMTVERAELDDDPSDAVIVHERDDSWEQLETTVAETSDGEVTLEARTDSFSLFAVAEPPQEDSSTQDGSEEPADGQEEPADDGQEEPADGSEEPADDGSPTALIIGLLVIVAIVAGVLYARNNNSS